MKIKENNLSCYTLEYKIAIQILINTTVQNIIRPVVLCYVHTNGTDGNKM